MDLSLLFAGLLLATPAEKVVSCQTEYTCTEIRVGKGKQAPQDSCHRGTAGEGCVARVISRCVTGETTTYYLASTDPKLAKRLDDTSFDLAWSECLRTGGQFTAIGRPTPKLEAKPKTKAWSALGGLGVRVEHATDCTTRGFKNSLSVEVTCGERRRRVVSAHVDFDDSAASAREYFNWYKGIFDKASPRALTMTEGLEWSVEFEESMPFSSPTYQVVKRRKLGGASFLCKGRAPALEDLPEARAMCDSLAPGTSAGAR